MNDRVPNTYIEPYLNIEVISLIQKAVEEGNKVLIYKIIDRTSNSYSQYKISVV